MYSNAEMVRRMRRAAERTLFEIRIAIDAELLKADWDADLVTRLAFLHAQARRQKEVLDDDFFTGFLHGR